MKRNTFKYLCSCSIATTIAPFFSLVSCSNPIRPIKPVEIIIDNTYKSSFVYSQKKSHTFSFELVDFLGNEVIYLEILNQKYNGESGQYVAFKNSENPTNKVSYVLPKQDKLSEEIETTILQNSDLIGEITFDINFVVLRDGLNVLNQKIENFTFYLAHPTTSSMFIIDETSEAEVILKGFNLQNHSEEIKDCDLLLIPENITKIDDDAFFHNGQSTIGSNFKWLDFETNTEGHYPILNYIGNNAFNSAPFTNSVIIPDTVDCIGSHAFERCKQLNGYLHLPKWLVTLGSYAFNECENIQNIEIVGNILENIPDFAFNKCFNLKSLSYFPSYIKKIGTRAFAECKKLKLDLIIPKATKNIGDYAFYDCQEITSLSFEKPDESNLESIGNYAFAGSQISSNVTFPNLINRIGVSAFDGCKLGGSFTFPSEIIQIGDYAFRGCNFSWSLDFNDKIQSIGVGAFNNCNNLHIINLTNIISSEKPSWLFDENYEIFDGIPTYGIILYGSQGGKLTSWETRFKERFTQMNEWLFNRIN